MSARDRRHDYGVARGEFPAKTPVQTPEYFNIAQACLISHARDWPDAIAIMDFSSNARIWTYGEMALAAKKTCRTLAGQWRATR